MARKIILILLLMNSCFKINSQNLIDLIPSEIDLGEVQTGIIHYVYFLFENVHTDSIIITNVQSSWGGIVGEFPNHPIGVGDKDTIFLQMFDNEGGNRIKNTSIAVYDFPNLNLFEQEIFTLKWVGVDSMMTSVDKNDNENKLMLSPNPFVDEIVISNTGLYRECAQIEIYDVSGKCILETTKYQFGSKIKISPETESGLYFISIYFEDKIYTMKIMKK